MEKSKQIKRAQTLRALHRPPPTLLLPNAWDVMSARIFAAAGYPAIATTSGGVAWALGYADGEKTPWPEVVDATARIVRRFRVPVTADIEAGYGETPDESAAPCREIIASRGGWLQSRRRRRRRRLRSDRGRCGAHPRARREVAQAGRRPSSSTPASISISMTSAMPQRGSMRR